MKKTRITVSILLILSIALSIYGCSSSDTKENGNKETKPYGTSAPSEKEVSAPTATSAPTPTSTPKPTSTPTPTPKPTNTPTPTPKPTNTPTPTPVIAKPEGLTYEYRTDDGALHLEWDDVEGAVHYEIELNGESVGYVDVSCCKLSSVQEGTSGTVRVRAINEEGVFSEWRRVDYDIKVSVKKPTEMSYEYGLDNETWFLHVNWKEVDGAVSYEIEANGSPAGTVTTAGCVFDDLSNCSSGTVKVRSINASGEYSAWSSIDYVMDDSISFEIQAPQNLKVQNRFGKFTKTAWDPVPDAAGYEVWYFGDFGSSEQQWEKPIKTGENVYFFLSEGDETQERNFYVRAYRKDGNLITYSDWSKGVYNVISNYKNYYYLNTCVLDYDRLIAWINNTGYQSTSGVRDDGLTMVVLYIDDPDHSAASNIAGDAASAGVDSFVDNTFDLWNALGALANGESPTDYLVDNLKNAGMDALVAGANTAYTEYTSDHRIMCCWMFDNTDSSPILSYFLVSKADHANYETEILGNLNRSDDGYYHLGVKDSNGTELANFYSSVFDYNEYYWLVYETQFTEMKF